MTGPIDLTERDRNAAGLANDDILAIVQRMKAIQTWMPLGIFCTLAGIPVLISIFRGTLLDAVFSGVLMGVLAAVVISFVEKIAIRPLQIFRYRRAAITLDERARQMSNSINQSLYWWEESPGALSITRDGELLVMDGSTKYAPLWLGASQLVEVSVEQEKTQITRTDHSARSRDSFFGGSKLEGKSQSLTTTAADAFLEIRYQLERNGPTCTVVIPFAAERRAAEEWRATIARLDSTSVRVSDD